jgi:hypothetical protein
MKVLLPTPGTPLMPRRKRAAAVRQQGVEQRVGAGAVVGAGRFQQRDGLGHRRGAGPDRAPVTASTILDAAPGHAAGRSMAVQIGMGFLPLALPWGTAAALVAGQ